ncbi:MAG: protein kinase [archaeon]|nr:protein kinase [archaeon]
MDLVQKEDFSGLNKFMNAVPFNVNFQDSKGWSALHYICQDGNLKITYLLIRRGIKLNLQTNDKKTPLHIAALNGFFDISKILIEKGAKLNMFDKDKNLPVHLAAKANHIELVRYLIEKYYASVDIKNIYGSTPIDLIQKESDRIQMQIYFKSLSEVKGKVPLKPFDSFKTPLKLSKGLSKNFTKTKINEKVEQIFGMTTSKKPNSTHTQSVGDIPKAESHKGKIPIKKEFQESPESKFTKERRNTFKNSIRPKESGKLNKMLSNEEKINTEVNSDTNHKNNYETEHNQSMQDLSGVNNSFSLKGQNKNARKTPQNMLGGSLAKKYNYSYKNVIQSAKAQSSQINKTKEKKMIKKSTATNVRIKEKKLGSGVKIDRASSRSRALKKRTISLPKYNHFFGKNKDNKNNIPTSHQKGVANVEISLDTGRSKGIDGLNTSNTNTDCCNLSQCQATKPFQLSAFMDILSPKKEKKNRQMKTKEDKGLGNKSKTKNNFVEVKVREKDIRHKTEKKEIPHDDNKKKIQMTKEPKILKSNIKQSKKEKDLKKDLKKENKSVQTFKTPQPFKKAKKNPSNLSGASDNSFNTKTQNKKPMKEIQIADDENQINSDNSDIEDNNNEEQNNTDIQQDKYCTPKKSEGGTRRTMKENEETSTTKEDKNKKVNANSFLYLGLLGKGSFGEVYLVEKKDTKQKYALKVLDKDLITNQNITKYVMTERNVLSVSSHPFIVKLNYAFQTKYKLLLLLDYCPGGDLSKQIQAENRFKESKAKFYLCEIILALGDLHSKDIIFRDLKPDNVVLDEEGHAMLTDFGLSREGVNEARIAKSFCGSIAYLAPEMLWRTGHGKPVDWYLLGVLFYEMLVGIPPFFNKSKQKIFNNIKNADLQIPSFVSAKASKLLQDLLVKDPSKRLGAKNDVEEIKKHPYFSDVNWDDVYNRRLSPPSFKLSAGNVELFDEPKLFDDDDDDKDFENFKANGIDSNFQGWSFINTIDNEEKE